MENIVDKNWISAHIFYSSNPNPLLVECVAPLVEKLRAQDLIARYFFIRYWLGGPHIRLRLLPTAGVTEQAVKDVVEPEVQAFLSRRPALYEIDTAALAPIYKRLYFAEYGPDAFTAEFGEDGELPFYPNNSLHYVAYEPEVQRYGGLAGVDLAERHFEVSSNIVLRLSRDTNIHIRSIMFGHAIQLMIQTCYGFLEDDARVSAFFQHYMDFWQGSFGQNINNNSNRLMPRFIRKYDRVAHKLQKRVADIRAFVQARPASSGTEVERMWSEHIRELRASVSTLFAAGQIELPEVEDEAGAFRSLLRGYIHMTNNRLGVNISDEVYLSYLLRRAIEHMAEAKSEEVSVG